MLDTRLGKRVVIKVGTKHITDLHSENTVHLRSLAAQIDALWEQGKDLVLVSSGAVGLGYLHLRSHVPEYADLSDTQKSILAACGQIRGVELWKQVFAEYGLPVAQYLVTKQEIKTQVLAKILEETLAMRIFPIVNENDALSTEISGFIDNDNVGAQVASALHADTYVILTNVDGLYRNFGQDNAERIPYVDFGVQGESVDSLVRHKADVFTRGGMESKLSAVRIALSGGVQEVFVTNGFRENALLDALTEKRYGTRFVDSSKVR